MKKLLATILTLAFILQLVTVQTMPVFAVPTSQIGQNDFLKADGIYIKDNYGTGNKVALHGTNLGGWLLQEAWMSPLGDGPLNQAAWTVSASSTALGSDPANAIDGDLNTRWTSGVTQAPGQWFKVDLGAIDTFDKINLDVGTSTGDYPVEYLVQISSDGYNWTDVASGTGFDGQMVIEVGGAQTARYILILQQGTGSSWWSISDLNVTMGDEWSVRTALYDRFGVTDTDDLFEYYQSEWLKESDLDNIANMGMNFVRVPMHWLNFMHTDGTWKADPFAELDWLAQECGERGIYILLDFHGAPGGVNPWASCGQAGPTPNGLWTDTNNQDMTVEMWRGLATHFKGNPVIAAYGLLNEPILGFPESEALRTQKYDFYDRLYDEVRAIDPDHIVVIEEFHDWSVAVPPWEYGWENIIYEKHHYDMANAFSWDAQNNLIEGALSDIAYMQGQWDVPIYIGEYCWYFFDDLWAKWMSGLNSLDVTWTNWTYKVRGTEGESGGGNWGFYNSNTNDVPDMDRDSLLEIESKWDMFSTDNFQANTGLINVVSQFTDGSVKKADFRLDNADFTATASTSSAGDPANILDYDFGTRWSSGAGQSGGEWIEVDMGAVNTISKVSIETVDSNDYPAEFEVYVSTDGTNYTLVDSGLGFGYKMVFLTYNVQARYVKIVQTGSNASNWWSVSEFGVYSETPTAIEAGTEPYKNATLPVATRVADLLSRMTLKEKIGQMLQVERVNTSPDEVYLNSIGSVLSGGGSSPNPNTATAWADEMDLYQNGALSTRLQIPILYGVDAVHGHNNVYGATIFPHNVGLGATRDAALLQQIGEATATEVRATGINWDFAPCLAVPQDDRWGRSYEGYSEVPSIVTELGTAYTVGLQGNESDPDFLTGNHVAASIKHWIGDGTTENGDDQGNSNLSDADLAPYIRPFEAAIEAGARTVMVHLGSLNGVDSHGDYHLITEMLKGDLGFDGIVSSDWNGINRLNSNYTEALKAGINAGIDMCMEADYWKAKDFIGSLEYLVNTGQVSQARIDDAVTRILTVKFETGVFENPYTDRSIIASGQFGGQSHRDIAREAVRKSATLLKNDEELLPLAKDAKVFVAGVKANNIGYQSGGWTITWQGNSGQTTLGTTILEGIENAVTSPSNVTYSIDGTGAAGHDVAIVVIGEEPYAEMDGDVGVGQPNANLDLSSGWSQADQNILDQVKASGIPTVVIMLSGRPMNITDRLGDWDSFIAAWLPGTEGDGLADVIFGDYPFTAKTSTSWPKYFDSANIKVNMGDSNYAPLFPFDYGLTADATDAIEVPALIEAEYAASTNGVNSEATGDNGGGLNLGWIDTGDTMTYKVNVEATGSYDVKLRVASQNGATGAIALKQGTTTLATYDVPATGGWQTYTTISQTVSLTQGVQDLTLEAVNSGWNINYLEFAPNFDIAPTNLLNNRDFESGNLNGWSTWNSGVNAAFADTDNPYRDTYKLTYWEANNYQQLVSQTLTLPNGTYQFSAWARSGGGQKALHLYASGYGGLEVVKEIGSGENGWKQYTIDNIVVTNGQIEVGVWTDAFGGNWAAFDDFELIQIN